MNEELYSRFPMNRIVAPAAAGTVIVLPRDPVAGEWTWTTASQDPGLDAAEGKFQVVEWTDAEKQANPARRGFIRVSHEGPRAGRYFEYTDGTPFLWVGDTWWNWTKRGIQFSSFQKLADDRSAKGFTVGQVFFAGNSGLLNRTCDSPNLEQIRKVEEMIAYANGKGITVWIHPLVETGTARGVGVRVCGPLLRCSSLAVCTCSICDTEAG